MRDPAARFRRYLQQWWEHQLQGAPYPGDWLHGREADALASEFRRDAQFELTQARFLHRRPDERSARDVVDQLHPLPIEADAEILVQAIVRAGATAQKVRATTAIGATLTVFAFVLRNVLRGR